MQSHADLDKLCELALSQGASAAAVLGTEGVVLDPRVRLKCMVPRCANYGRNLMCPPNVMEVEEFAKVLKQYSRSIVVQYPIPLDSELMEGLKDQSIEDIYGHRGVQGEDD